MPIGGANQFPGQTAGFAEAGPQTIVLIDDDPAMAAMLSTYLSGEGFSIEHATTGAGGLRLAGNPTTSVVLLDVVLPDIDGFEVLRRLRAKSHVPVIMLTMQGAVRDRVRGFERGADDYVPKPFAPIEVLARVRSLLRRSRHLLEQQPRLTADDLLLIRASHAVLKDGRPVPCTTAEFDALYSLVWDSGGVITKEDLTRSALGRCSYSGDRGVDNLVHSLRKKLGPRSDGGERFKAVRGIGYIYLRSNED